MVSLNFPSLPDGIEPHLTPHQVAAVTGVARSTLARWRMEGTGPRYVLVSRRAARYPLSAVKQWLGECQQKTNPASSLDGEAAVGDSPSTEINKEIYHETIS